MNTEHLSENLNDDFQPYVREYKNITIWVRVPESTSSSLNSILKGSGVGKSDALRFIFNDYISSGKKIPNKMNQNKEGHPIILEHKNVTLWVRVPESTSSSLNSLIKESDNEKSDALRFILNDFLSSGKKIPGTISR